MTMSVRADSAECAFYSRSYGYRICLFLTEHGIDFNHLFASINSDGYELIAVAGIPFKDYPTDGSYFRPEMEVLSDKVAQAPITIKPLCAWMLQCV